MRPNKVKRAGGLVFSLLLAGVLLGFLSNPPESEETCTTETSVYCQQATQRYVSDDKRCSLCAILNIYTNIE
jgi:hypothetical protein